MVGDRLEVICLDGGVGLLAALPTAYPGVPVKRCGACKIRNALAKAHLGHQPAIKADLRAITNAPTVPRARCRRLAASPTARRQLCTRRRLAAGRPRRTPRLLVLVILSQREAVRLTNAIERRFREVRRRARPMGIFSDGSHTLRRRSITKTKTRASALSSANTNLFWRHQQGESV
jgi:transposase-like protein